MIESKSALVAEGNRWVLSWCRCCSGVSLLTLVGALAWALHSLLVWVTPDEAGLGVVVASCMTASICSLVVVFVVAVVGADVGQLCALELVS